MRETIIKVLGRCGETYNPTYSDSTLISTLRNSDKVDWDSISAYQRLSENFIREFQDRVRWIYISARQKLSEDFIREFIDEVSYSYISLYQKLSEDFIREFQDKVDWIFISVCQDLSEDFIREFKDKVAWVWVSRGQKLSDSFLKEFKLTKPDLRQNWLYATDEYKLDYIKNNTQYEVIDDKYVIAYISEVFGYDIEGETYERHCSYAQIPSWDSTLIANTKDYANGTSKKVRIHLEDVGVVDTNGKIHCSRWTVLPKNSTVVKETCPRCSTELIEKLSHSFLGSITYPAKKCPNCGYCG